MDPWINSLVQSPLVRSLNTVPSRMSSFAYGVRDNVPPFSFAKEVVDQSGGAQALGWDPTAVTVPSTNLNFDFRIPESGLLDRMYLRVRVFSTHCVNVTVQPRRPLLPVSNAATASTKITRDAMSNSMNFASILETVTLQTTGNKVIQTLYPAAIAAEVQKMPSAQREFWLQCLNGFAAGQGALASPLIPIAPMTTLYNPYAEYGAAAGNASSAVAPNQHMVKDFLIPLPFSVMDQLKDNFQTRFVDDLTVQVKFRESRGVTSVIPVPPQTIGGTPGFRASLVCIFHNFHDVIENSIRDQNFKRGFPASVYSHNYLSDVTSSFSGKKLTVRIGSKNLISEMYFALRRQSNDANNTVHTYALPPNDGTVGPFRFTLYGSGRQLWQAYSWELNGPDTADYQLADSHAYGEDLAHAQLARIETGRSVLLDAAGSGVVAGTSASVPMDRVTLGFPHLYSVRFGFQAHDNFYTGGLALQTISNPYVEIENLGSSADMWDTGADKYTMDVILKSCQMLRIDSDTGVITTSLDV
jgi:hypothetical protein